MIKKLLIPLLIIVFLAWFFIGYLSAGLFAPVQSSIVSDAIPGTGLALHQNTFLIIRTSDLQSPSPQLYSVWAIFFYPMQPPIMMFLPLFPVEDPETDSTLLSSFVLESSGQPGATFLSTIGDLYQFDWDGYLMVDDSVASAVNSNLSTYTQLPISPIPPISDQTSYLSASSIWIQSFCSFLPGQNTLAFTWQNFAPSHFRSNMNLDVALSIWTQMTNLEYPISCEILSSQ